MSLPIVVNYSDGVTLTVDVNTIEVAYVTDSGHRVHQRYQGYTRRQCRAMFRDYLASLGENLV
jgi:hypothetical protein